MSITGSMRKIRWTKKEVEYLKDNYKVKFYSEIAQDIGKSEKSVSDKAYRMKLKSGPRGQGRDQKGSKNGNWKGGISKNRYAYKKKSIAKYPEKNKARVALGTAIRYGKIIRPTICEGCKKPNKRIEGHHEDYSKPLDVDWLCKKCHNVADKKHLLIPSTSKYNE